jgi:hypothetical protein
MLPEMHKSLLFRAFIATSYIEYKSAMRDFSYAQPVCEEYESRYPGFSFRSRDSTLRFSTGMFLQIYISSPQRKVNGLSGKAQVPYIVCNRSPVFHSSAFFNVKSFYRYKMKYLPLNPELFVLNRSNLISQLKPGSIAILNSNDIMPTSADGALPFRQQSDMFYLSGIDQEESILLLFPDAPETKHREVLFLRETNDEIAIWEGS